MRAGSGGGHAIITIPFLHVWMIPLRIMRNLLYLVSGDVGPDLEDVEEFPNGRGADRSASSLAHGFLFEPMSFGTDRARFLALGSCIASGSGPMFMKVFRTK